MRPSRASAWCSPRTARAAQLDADLAALGDQALVEGEMGWDYLLLTARRS